VARGVGDGDAVAEDRSERVGGHHLGPGSVSGNAAAAEPHDPVRVRARLVEVVQDDDDGTAALVGDPP
jgi:hypothetical protein